MTGVALKDRTYLIENLLSIDTKEGEVIPFKLNSVQRYFAAHKSSRNIVVKARQLGVSSYILADMFVESISVPHSPCAVVSHETRATQRLLDRVHFYYDTFPEPRPEKGADSRSEITFPGMHSSIYIGTAGSRAFGRGDTLRKAHLSEFAFYDDEERILAGVEDAVPLSGELTIETTPNGEDDLLYLMWCKAREGRSGYKTFFFPWWLDKGYTLSRDHPLALEDDRGELHYDAEEADLVERFHITEGQIRWRRWKISNKGGTFYRDYPEDELTCFQQSGEPVFDTALIQELAKGCYEGEKHEQGFTFWEPVIEKGHYIVGADTSAGVEGGSYSAAAVLDVNYRVVATFQGRLDPHRFASLLIELGKYYNNAELAVERNFTGYAVLSYLTEYPNVYYERDFTTGRVTNKPGWWTREATKEYLITAFKETLPKLKTWDANLVRQARGYRYVRYKATAQSFDDLLMATMIAIAVRKVLGIARGYQGAVKGWNW